MDRLNRSKIETPSSKLTSEQLQDFVTRVNAYKSGSRNVYYSVQDIKMKIDNKIRKNPSMPIEEAVAEIIVERQNAIDGLNSIAA